MFEIATSGILGSLIGGLFRLAPEVLKLFTKKEDNKHELEMFKLQTELEKVKGDYRVEEKYVDFSVAQIQAIQAANEAEGKAAASSYKWVSALSVLVRPIITYALFALYVAVKITFIAYAYSTGAPWIEVMKQNWTVDDFALLNMILTYWFIGRSIEKYQSKR